MCSRIKGIFSGVIGQMLLFVVLAISFSASFIFHVLPRIFEKLTPDTYASWIQALGVVIAMFFSTASIWWSSKLATERKRDAVLALVNAVLDRSEQICSVITQNPDKELGLPPVSLFKIYSESIYNSYFQLFDSVLKDISPITSAGVDAILGMRDQCFFFGKSVNKLLSGVFLDSEYKKVIDGCEDDRNMRHEVILRLQQQLAQNVQSHFEEMKKCKKILDNAKF